MWGLVAKVVTKAAQAMPKTALANMAAKLTTSLGVKVPGNVSGFLSWAKKWITSNPLKAQALITVMYSAGDIVVRNIMDDAVDEVPALKVDEEISAIRAHYKHSDLSTKLINNIAGDGNAETIHGKSVEEYRKDSALISDRRALVAEALEMFASKENLMLARAAILTLETEDIMSYEA